jgi:hypothetical protein
MTYPNKAPEKPKKTPDFGAETGKKPSPVAFNKSSKLLYLLENLSKNSRKQRVDPSLCCMNATKRPFLFQNSWKSRFALVQ